MKAIASRAGGAGSMGIGFDLAGLSSAKSKSGTGGDGLTTSASSLFRDSCLSLGELADASSGEVDFCSSFRRFSSPLTRFRRASRTSVLGPRFFGMAS